MGRRARDWKLTRTRIVERDLYRCRCAREGCHGEGVHNKAGGLEVHHIREVRHGGDDSDGNLVSLCRSCHLNRHRRLPTEGEREWLAFVQELLPPVLD